jgi:hypothetical protein
MTPDLDLLLQEEIMWAIAQKQKCPVDEPEAFAMRVKVIGPIGQIANTPLQWGSMEQQHAMMAALSEVCKRTYAQAAIITTDIRYLLPEQFCEHFGLPMPTPATLKQWNKERERVMKPFNYEFGKLPRHTWEEALMATAYGPRVSKMVTAKYQVQGNGFVFQPPERLPDNGGLQVCMLPAWWD